MRLLGSLFLSLLGWKVKGNFPYHLKKSIVIAGPHTSTWDFIIGLGVRSKLRLQHIKFLGKASLFKGPFGFIFRKLGGYPVEREQNHNMVEQVVDLFNSHDSFSLVLSPEGTRKKVNRLKTGFYHIAKKAKIPIVMAGFDFANKEFSFSKPFYPSDDETADFLHIYQFFAPLKGKISELGMAHFLQNPS